jgi:CheY-like chemotaxis protein
MRNTSTHNYNETPSRIGPYRVLVVEDNPDLARTATLLQLHGLEVETLATGLPVVDTARSFRPHFIVLDIGLPDIDGYEVAERLRKDPELNAITIIGVSAYSPGMYLGRERPEHFDHYLVKPVNFTDLLSLLGPALSSTAERISALDHHAFQSMISCANSWRSDCD